MYILLSIIASLGWTFGVALLLISMIPKVIVPRGWGVMEDLLEEERERMILIGILLVAVGTLGFILGDFLSGVWSSPWKALW